MNGDLKNENPRRPRDTCKKGSLEDRGWRARPSASHSATKALGRPSNKERKAVQTLVTGLPGCAGAEGMWF